jgi:plastocyanin
MAAVALAPAARTAAAAAPESPPPPTGKTVKIKVAEVDGKLRFVAPKTVTQGDTLKIVNSTDPKKVGPHTFSLVKKGVLPKTGPARKACFSPKHICLSIAMWHKFNPKTEKIGLNPVEVGPAGWSTAGDNAKKGDSWFTEKKGETFEQQVTAEPGDLYYICAVHAWMQGKVKVVAPVAPLPAS